MKDDYYKHEFKPPPKKNKLSWFMGVLVMIALIAAIILVIIWPYIQW